MVNGAEMARVLVVDDNVLTALHGALASSITSGNDTTVAIVDDDDDVGAVLQGLLELVGYNVATYRSGRQFLADAPLGHVSCLVVDQSMPDMTGLEVVAQLRAMGLTIPSLLITGCREETIGRQASDLGVMEVMDKPIETGNLLRLIARSAE
jgi:two-component system response regulator FixJ